MVFNKLKKITFVLILLFIIMFLIPNLIYKSYAATAITASGGTLSAGEYYLSKDINLTTNITIANGVAVTIDLNGFMLQGTGSGNTITNRGTLTIIDSKPTSVHKGTLNTNGVWTYNTSGAVTINGGIITNKAAGCVIHNNGTLNMQAGTITGASSNLGAITNASSGFTNITGGKIMYNYSTNTEYGGAGIYGNEPVNGNTGATILVSNAEISYNHAAGNGAGIWAGARLEISNSKISHNIAEKSGGGIFAVHGATISNNTEISYNTGNSYAGGIVVTNDVLSIDSSIIKENVAGKTSGGGIFIEKGASLELSNSEVSNNTSLIYGGGIFSYGDMNISNTSIIYNDCIKDSSTATGSGRGGGLCINSSNESYPAHAELTNVNVDYNRAMYYGGGMQIMGAYASLVLNSGSVSHNETFIEGAAGIHLTSSGTFTMYDGSIMEYNYARNVGGAIHSSYGCTLNLFGGEISNNTVVGRGGGVNVNVGGIINLDGTDVKNNKAITGINYTYAKYENREVTFIPSDLDEEVNGCGGGVVIDSGDFIMNNGIVSNNYASHYGGGIALVMKAIDSKDDIDGNKIVNFTINDGEISNNSTDGDGGGVYLMENSFKYVTDVELPDELKNGVPTFTANGGVIKNNTAKGNGGGTYLDIDTKFIMNDEAVIENNEALKSGGAVYISKGTAEINNGTMINNKASQDGGAIYINGTVLVNDGLFENNKASKSGGGVAISNGDYTMNGGKLINNQALEHGGGIYASSDTQNLNVTITSGSIIGNIASINGGGVGINIDDSYSANVTVGLKSCMGENDSHSHPVIQDNTANQNGGGFWTHGDNMVMNMYCGNVTNNIALLESGSANIYQTGGQTTIHSGTVGEGVIVIGGKYDYVPYDAEEVSIIYNSNIDGNIQTKEAFVTEGIEINLPEKIYTREGYILIGWSYSKTPTESEIFYINTPYMVTDQPVVVYAVWRIIGAGEIEVPKIKSGKYYDSINNGTNILITSNSSFTAEMTVNDMKPNLYNDRTLLFDKNLPNGTTILMIDKTDINNRKYYSYKVLNDFTKEIKLINFIKCGSNENYNILTGDTEVDESFLFIVDLPKENSITGPNHIALIRNAVDTNTTAPIEQILSYTTTDKRMFDFKFEVLDENENDLLDINDTLKFIYTKEIINEDDTRYSNKNLTLVISGDEGNIIPEDTKLLIGSNECELKADGKFVIPFDNVLTDKQISLKFVSDTILENEFSCKIKAELYTIENDYNRPFMKENVVKISSIDINSLGKPGIELDMNGRVKYADEMGDSITLSYETLNIDENHIVTLEVQKKNDLDEYETNSSLVQSVSSSSDLGNGKYSLNLSDSGKIKVTFLDNLILEKGTYRVYLEVKEEGKVILKVPYNFIILEKEEIEE